MSTHVLIDEPVLKGIRYEKHPCKREDGTTVEGLYTARITLDNPKQYNSYTTDMVKSVILAFRQASMEEDVVAVIFTGEGDRAFCTGGNTKEYAEIYAGRPNAYSQYMVLFNDMVSAILACDKPVICRVNGMRIAGGQEIGMACDFTFSSDLAVFGQAGPKHGSAPDGGSTDFLPLYTGIEHAMFSCTACEVWSAHKALRLGLITDLAPALKIDGKYVTNPMVISDRYLDEWGRIIHGEMKTGDALADAKDMLRQGHVCLDELDRSIDRFTAKLMNTMPNCLNKTIQSLRKHKLEHWNRNKESNRSWLGLNMMTEAKLGFRAFNEGPRHQREIDFVALRTRLAQGERWSDAFIDSLIPK